MKNYYGLFLVFVLVSATTHAVAVKENGRVIIEPGVFYPGCYYGADESVSDHAPVIYDTHATWNVAAPLSHFAIRPNDHTKFFNHKFFTNDKGALVNREGDAVSRLGSSEVFLMKSIKKDFGYAAVNHEYIKRVDNIMRAIRDIFKRETKLDYMVLQEIPSYAAKTVSGEKVQNLMKERFLLINGEEFTIQFFKVRQNKDGTPKKLITKTGKHDDYKKNLIPDVALVSRATAAQLRQWHLADHDSRVVPFCSRETKSCFAAVHMPYTASDEELATRCDDIKTMASRLLKQHDEIKFAGDFNTSANRIAKVCGDILPIKGSRVELNTSKHRKGTSCGSNTGHLTEEGIDVMISYYREANYQEEEVNVDVSFEQTPPAAPPIAPLRPVPNWRRLAQEKAVTDFEPAPEATPGEDLSKNLEPANVEAPVPEALPEEAAPPPRADLPRETSFKQALRDEIVREQLCTYFDANSSPVSKFSKDREALVTMLNQREHRDVSGQTQKDGTEYRKFVFLKNGKNTNERIQCFEKRTPAL